MASGSRSHRPRIVGAPPGSDTEHEATAGQRLQRRRHLRREQVGGTVAEDVVTQGDIGELGAQPGEGGPGFQEGVGASVEAIEVVSDPQAVEDGRAVGRMCSCW